LDKKITKCIATKQHTTYLGKNIYKLKTQTRNTSMKFACDTYTKHNNWEHNDVDIQTRFKSTQHEHESWIAFAKQYYVAIYTIQKLNYRLTINCESLTLSHKFSASLTNFPTDDNTFQLSWYYFEQRTTIFNGLPWDQQKRATVFTAPITYSDAFSKNMLHSCCLVICNKTIYYLLKLLNVTSWK
jgi:hypothetical protein